MGDTVASLGARTWTTREGQIMKWSKMTPSHLRNTAAFIRRQHSAEISSAYRAYSMVQGDAAEFSIEGHISSLEEQSADVDALASDMERFAQHIESAS